MKPAPADILNSGVGWFWRPEISPPEIHPVIVLIELELTISSYDPSVWIILNVVTSSAVVLVISTK